MNDIFVSVVAVFLIIIVWLTLAVSFWRDLYKMEEERSQGLKELINHYIYGDKTR